MSIFSKFDNIAQERTKLIQEYGGNFLNTCFDEIFSPTEASLNGKTIILAGSNNYLGLTFDPDCIDAACEYLKTQGTGTTGSRMANGTYNLHQALEQDLTHFYNCSTTIVFSTGFQAVSGSISALTDQNDVIFLDADSHASIYDGCFMSRAQVYRFRHNDPANLRKRIQKVQDCTGNILICIEGIYSMLGDRAKLNEFIEIKKDYNAYLLIDEAHSLGVLGNKGSGLVEELGVEDQVDFIVGTFSKSLGAIGGFCCSKHPELDFLRYVCRQYMFTASSSPAQIASVRTALKKLRDNPQFRTNLWNNAHLLYNSLNKSGIELGPEPSPIVAVRLNSQEQALFFWQELLNKGVYVNIVFPPATPDKRPLLRCSVSAAHSETQIQTISWAISEINKTWEKTCQDIN